MNYFAHGFRFVGDPWFLVGTALPDWLNVVDRRVRVRRKRAEPFLEDSDSRVARLARGVTQHHRDDDWFHATRAFAETSMRLTRLARDLLPRDDGFRPGFLGHILVELLLDDRLIGAAPGGLESYYQAFERLDADEVAAVAEHVAGRPIPRLGDFMRLFVESRFLCDYAEDAKLYLRLNQVMRRVGLPVLPAEFCELAPESRRVVAARQGELMRSDCPVHSIEERVAPT